MKFTMTFDQAQLKRQAVIAQGLNPQALGQKPGGRRHRDRKRDAARGIVKHRSRAFD